MVFALTPEMIVRQKNNIFKKGLKKLKNIEPEDGTVGGHSPLTLQSLEGTHLLEFRLMKLSMQC